MSNDWSDRVPDNLAYARAAGRRRYNADRRADAEIRRMEVKRLLLTYNWHRGVQAEIAEGLGVSPSTVCRDMKLIFRDSVECICGTRYPIEWWRDERRIGPGRFHFDPTRHFGEDEAQRWKLVLVRNRQTGAEQPERNSDQREPVEDDDIKRFMALTGQIAEEFAGGIAEADEVEMTSHLHEHDDDDDDVQVITHVEPTD